MPGDVAVQLVRRLEGRHRAAGAAVGEQQRLQHLVRPVGGEHLLGRDAVQRGDRGAQLGGGRSLRRFMETCATNSVRFQGARREPVE